MGLLQGERARLNGIPGSPVACCILVLCAFVLCTGFTLPSPARLKDSLRQELEKIREKGPGARQLARWREEYERAVSVLEEAELQGAQRYAPDTWHYALGLLSRAKEYARQKAYPKAAFLAKKAREQGKLAIEEAEKARESALKQARATLERLKKQLDAIKAGLEADSKPARKRLNELLLQWTDLVRASELEQFEDVDAGAKELEARIRELRRRIERRGKQ